MAYVPRRRLVLANARSAGVHAQWSSSQTPWDAEEDAFAADDQQICANFEAACFTQESALAVNQDKNSQPDHHLVCHVDSRATEQAPSSLHNMPSCEPASSLQQQCSHAAARDQFTLPQEEYRDIYNFLTKGTGQVQAMSAVERALFKLANLRQDALQALVGLQLIHPSTLPVNQAQTPTQGIPPVTETQRSTQAQGCIGVPQAVTAYSTQQQQHAWPHTPQHNSSARHLAVTEHDGSMAWGLGNNLNQAAADQSEHDPIAPSADTPLHPSQHLAPGQPLHTPSTQVHYPVNSSETAESAHMPAVSASVQAVLHQHCLYSATPSLPDQQDPAAQRCHLHATGLPPCITEDNTHAAVVCRSSQPEAQSGGRNPAEMRMYCNTSQQHLTEALQQPVNASTSLHMAGASDNTHTRPDTLQTPQPTTSSQSHRLWPGLTEVTASSPVPLCPQAAVQSSGPLHLHFATNQSTALQHKSHEVVKDDSPASAAPLEGVSAETAASPTTIKAPLHSLAGNSQAGSSGHLGGSSRSPAGVTAHAWKRTNTQEHGAVKMACGTAGGTNSQTLSHPNHEHSSAVLPSQQPDPISAAASAIGNHSAADDEPSTPSTLSESTALNLDTGMAGHGSAQKNPHGSQAVAADADATTACTAVIALGDHAAASHHEDCPIWLPEQIAHLQQQYSNSAAGSRAGLSGDALLGQRVAFALLEDFHQHDSRGEVDTLLAGVHTGQVVQQIGEGHHPDMCADSCAAQHQWFYVRVCPDRSQTIKPGLKRKRRLDLKMDLSSSNCRPGLQELLGLSAAQLEDAWVLVLPTTSSLTPDKQVAQPIYTLPAAAARSAYNDSTKQVGLGQVSAKPAAKPMTSKGASQASRGRCLRGGRGRAGEGGPSRGREGVGGQVRGAGKAQTISQRPGHGVGIGSSRESEAATTGRLPGMPGQDLSGQIGYPATASGPAQCRNKTESIANTAQAVFSSSVQQKGKHSSRVASNATPLTSATPQAASTPSLAAGSGPQGPTSIPLLPSMRPPAVATSLTAETVSEAEAEECPSVSAMKEGCVVWVPFGAANWPAKVVSIAAGATGTALVQLYASGISTEVDAAGLTAFADGYEQKCKTVQSQLGRQAVKMADEYVAARTAML